MLVSLDVHCPMIVNGIMDVYNSVSSDVYMHVLFV